jgi:hypothetical protein
MLEFYWRGFVWAGDEILGRDKFDPGTAMFLPVVERSEESIKEKYGEGGKYTVELILKPNNKIQEMIRKGIVSEEEASHLVVPEAEKSFLIFIKPTRKD